MLGAAAAAAASSGTGHVVHLVADDVDAFDDMVIAPVWERLLAEDKIRLVGSVETRSMTGYTTSNAVNELRRARRQLMLQPDDPTEFLQLTGIKLPLRPGVRLVPGRGVLLADRQPVVIQVRTMCGPVGSPSDRVDAAPDRPGLGSLVSS
jgi:hypothetical protein